MRIRFARMIDTRNRRKQTHIRLVLSAIMHLARKRIRLHDILDIASAEALVQTQHKLSIRTRELRQRVAEHGSALGVRQARWELRRRYDAW
jgi:hypothetical protein